jgi:hypothetical protein
LLDRLETWHFRETRTHLNHATEITLSDLQNKWNAANLFKTTAGKTCSGFRPFKTLVDLGRHTLWTLTALWRILHESGALKARKHWVN